MHTRLQASSENFQVFRGLSGVSRAVRVYSQHFYLRQVSSIRKVQVSPENSGSDSSGGFLRNFSPESLQGSSIIVRPFQVSCRARSLRLRFNAINDFQVCSGNLTSFQTFQVTSGISRSLQRISTGLFKTFQVSRGLFMSFHVSFNFFGDDLEFFFKENFSGLFHGFAGLLGCDFQTSPGGSKPPLGIFSGHRCLRRPLQRLYRGPSGSNR